MSRAFVLYLSAIVALFIALLIWGAAQPANAQTLCGPRREVIDAIKQSAQETEVWYGHRAPRMLDTSRGVRFLYHKQINI